MEKRGKIGYDTKIMFLKTVESCGSNEAQGTNILDRNEPLLNELIISGHFFPWGFLPTLSMQAKDRAWLRQKVSRGQRKTSIVCDNQCGLA